MLDRQDRIDASLTPEGYTPTLDSLPRRVADFATLGEALDYAAKGNRGMNFHDARGTLLRAYPYAELRQDAMGHARRFMALGLKKGDRLALVAETGPEFAACFFGAVYAGLWPVPLPLPTSFGGREAYIDQLVVMLSSSDPQLFLYPEELADFTTAAAEQRGVTARSWESLGEVEPAAAGELERGDVEELLERIRPDHSCLSEERVGADVEAGERGGVARSRTTTGPRTAGLHRDDRFLAGDLGCDAEVGRYPRVNLRALGDGLLTAPQRVKNLVRFVACSTGLHVRHEPERYVRPFVAADECQAIAAMPD